MSRDDPDQGKEWVGEILAVQFLLRILLDGSCGGRRYTYIDKACRSLA